jgi:hypothetical protein
MLLEPYGDNFTVVLLTDYKEHTPDKPFCWNNCPCHEKYEAISQVARFVNDGLMTQEEANDFVKGRGI